MKLSSTFFLWLAHILKLFKYCIIILYRLFTFEKAYCLYRLNRSEEALQLINEEPNHVYSFKELKAQILYKLEK